VIGNGQFKISEVVSKDHITLVQNPSYAGNSPKATLTKITLYEIEDPVVVTDLGFAKRARAFAELLDAPLAIIEKRRVGNLDRAELMNVIGDVKGKRAIIVDDEIDTGGTLVEITRALEREGVTEIYACATHGVLSDPAVDRIAASNLIEVVLTDSVPLPERKRLAKITTLSVAPLIGPACRTPSARTPFVIRSRRISSRAGRTCASFRSCSGMRVSARPSSTPT